MDHFEACIAHLGFPFTHRRAIGTTNQAVLKLMFGPRIRASERWHAVRITEFERRQKMAVRQELDEDLRFDHRAITTFISSHRYTFWRRSPPAFLPPREAGARISLVLMATVLGMACGGLASGFIYDATHSYQLAFLHGLMWNLVNLALVTWLLVWPKWKLRSRTAMAG